MSIVLVAVFCTVLGAGEEAHDKLLHTEKADPRCEYIVIKSVQKGREFLNAQAGLAGNPITMSLNAISCSIQGQQVVLDYIEQNYGKFFLAKHPNYAWRCAYDSSSDVPT